MKCFVTPDELPWLTLDAVTGSYLKNIFTIKEDAAEVACVLQKQEKGFEVPVHTHEEEHSVYLISGRVTVWIEGVGEFTATPGCMVRTPTGRKHSATVEEETVLLDVSTTKGAWNRNMLDRGKVAMG
jgi:quercetin dioxygenase-like cupin family protein